MRVALYWFLWVWSHSHWSEAGALGVGWGWGLGGGCYVLAQVEAACPGRYFQSGSAASRSAMRSWKLLRRRAASMSVATWLSG